MSRFTDHLGYFFRGAWEDYVFPIFSPLHLFLLLVLVAGILLIAVFREKIRKDPKRTLRNFLLGGLILEQITQYSWYALAGTFTLGDGLPLYICRTAIPAIILAYLTGNYYAKTLSVFWGSFGGFLAVLFPVIYPFYFPHLTNFTYFMGHFIMVWSVVYFLTAENYQFTKKGLAFALVFTNLFNYFVYRLNPLVNGNYSYFAYPPVFRELFGRLSAGNYAMLVFLIYNLLILLIYLIGRLAESRIDRKQGDRALG